MALRSWWMAPRLARRRSPRQSPPARINCRSATRRRRRSPSRLARAPRRTWSWPAPRPAAAASVGSVEITTTPPGAEVTVDGVPRGISPVQVAGLAPGPHAVTLARAGRLLRRTVTVEAGASVPLAVAMAGTGTGPGWLTVTSPVPALHLHRRDPGRPHGHAADAADRRTPSAGAGKRCAQVP